MGKLNTKKSLKKGVNLGKKRTIKGGGMGRAIAGAVAGAATGDTCDFNVKYDKKTVSLPGFGYTKNQLLKNLPNSEFIKLENQKFTGIFKQNLERFCVKNEDKKYIKFCVNFLRCADRPEKMYELLYQMFIFERTLKSVSEIKRKPPPKKNGQTQEEKEKEEQEEEREKKIKERLSKKEGKYTFLFNGKKKSLPYRFRTQYDKRKEAAMLMGKTEEEYTPNEFIKEYERETVTNVSKFLINVVKKSIISYDKLVRPPPNEKSPIIMKDKLEKLFTNLFGDKFEFERITQEKLEKLFIENKGAIEQYSDSRVIKQASEELVDDDKEVKKSPFYMFVILGAFITAIVLESGFMAAPPGLKGGMS